MPLFVPFVYLPSYAEERGVDPVLAAGLVGAIGTASVVGRLALGALAGAARAAARIPAAASSRSR